MENVDLVPLIEQLDDNIDDLEEALDPLLQKALSDTAGKLPLLDKAHLYVLVTYAIGSILFSFLRLNDVNVKDHPIFGELSRVKQYFEKVKVAESAGDTPNVKLDKAAAGRFIKNVLAGNHKRGGDLAQQQSIRKATGHVRFTEISKGCDVDGEEPRGPKVNESNDKFQYGSGFDDFNAARAVQPTKVVKEVPLAIDAMGEKVGKGCKRRTSTDGAEAMIDTNDLETNSKRERKNWKKLHKKQKVLEAAQN